MAAIADIVLADAQATPVNHTFSPAIIQNGQVVWEDRSASQYIGFNKLTLTLERPKTTSDSATGNRNLKLRMKLETPKLENVTNSTVSGIAPAPTVSYRPVFECVMTLPERCALQDRKDLRKMAAAAFNDPQLIAFFESYSIPY